MADGTTLNAGAGGDTISTETAPQGSNGATTGQKNPRSKLAVGPVDRDDGDVTEEVPLPVHDVRLFQKLDELNENIKLLVSALCR